MSRLQPGHVLAERYVIEAELGGGATGAVYRANDKNGFHYVDPPFFSLSRLRARCPAHSPDAPNSEA